MGLEFCDQPFVPVLLGSDIGAYSMARAFYESYGVQSHVFGKYATGPCWKSRIVSFHHMPTIERRPVFLTQIGQLADAYPHKTLLVLGCGDNYVRLAASCKDALPPNAVTSYMDLQELDRFMLKDRFYGLCDALGIDHPATVVYRGLDSTLPPLPFDYPAVVKPADSGDYFLHHWEGQKKAYTVGDENELLRVTRTSWEGGYRGAFVIQELIPGTDDCMRVLTSYSNQNGRVEGTALGHVLLEEHTPLGIGNHALVLTENDPELLAQVTRLLESVGYRGFSNIDVRFDTRTGRRLFLDFNVRQGRSNYYCTLSGFKVAEHLVDDLVFKKRRPASSPQAGWLWSVIPHRVELTYVRDPELHAQVVAAARTGFRVNPLFSAYDLAPTRVARLWRNHLRHYGNYRTYYLLQLEGRSPR